jgi:hypothetical protein
MTPLEELGLLSRLFLVGWGLLFTKSVYHLVEDDLIYPIFLVKRLIFCPVSLSVAFNVISRFEHEVHDFRGGCPLFVPLPEVLKEVAEPLAKVDGDLFKDALIISGIIPHAALADDVKYVVSAWYGFEERLDHFLESICMPAAIRRELLQLL